MNRRDAIKNVGLMAGGLTLIPYACSLSAEIVFSNLPNIKKEQQDLISLDKELVKEILILYKVIKVTQDNLM